VLSWDKASYDLRDRWEYDQQIEACNCYICGTLVMRMAGANNL